MTVDTLIAAAFGAVGGGAVPTVLWRRSVAREIARTRAIGRLLRDAFAHDRQHQAEKLALQAEAGRAQQQALSISGAPQ